jgi:hypothetical protein
LNCRLCGSQNTSNYAHASLKGRIVKYYECSICSYVQTEKPSWLHEAYKSPIQPSDTGIMVRNLANVGEVIAALTLMGDLAAKVVDYAGGYGFLVRLLRDKGVNAFWADRYTENLVARGFEYEMGSTADLVMAFEAFEHFLFPAEELQTLLSIAPNVLMTTFLIPTPTPKPSDWWYYGLDHGQHIGFYRVKTLRYIAQRFSLHLITDGNSVHFFSKNKYSQTYWRCLRRISRLSDKLLLRRLSPLTWSDHLTIAKSGNLTKD